MRSNSGTADTTNHEQTMKASEITNELLEQSSHSESDYALIRALCEHLDCEPDDLSEASYCHYGKLRIFELGNQQYAVGEESEADAAWDASLDSYLEECVYPELPEIARNYFDDEAWKRDARVDGRGHSLSSYDGNEDEIEADGETFYVYRLN